MMEAKRSKGAKRRLIAVSKVILVAASVNVAKGESNG
jgi:hypothetical protein